MMEQFTNHYFITTKIKSETQTWDGLGIQSVAKKSNKSSLCPTAAGVFLMSFQ